MTRSLDLPSGIIIPSQWRITRRWFRGGYKVTYLPTGVVEAHKPSLSECLDFINLRELEFHAFSLTGIPSKSGLAQLDAVLAPRSTEVAGNTGGTLVLAAGDGTDPSFH